MYEVTLINDGIETPIHTEKTKLLQGSVVRGINTIDSFSFSLLPSSAGFNLIHDFRTHVRVKNLNNNREEFYGRVLYSSASMNENGLIVKEVICESIMGYLCDSVQLYVEEKTWTVGELLSQIVSVHNAQVEDYKKIIIGYVEPSGSVYCGIQRKNTWETMQEKLLNAIGGEFTFTRNFGSAGGLLLDYFQEVGTHKTTPVELSRNMKSITRELNPTEFVSRLIPLGAKIKDSKGNETEQRLDISPVNGGRIYIDDDEAVTQYGVHVGVVEWDDVHTPDALLSKGREWLEANNKVQVKYTVSALDLSLLGLDVDDFNVGNYHPISNPLLSIDDEARIVKKTIDVCDETKTSIEFGDKFASLTDLQLKQSGQLSQVAQQQMTGLNAKLGRDEADQVVKMINEATEKVVLSNNRMTVFADNLSIEEDGTIIADALQMRGGSIQVLADSGARYMMGGLHGFQAYKETASGRYAILVLREDLVAFACAEEYGEATVKTTNHMQYHPNETVPYITVVGTWVGDVSGSIVSDANHKEGIDSLDDRYGALFDGMTPRRYKYKDGTSGRYHTGFIAQEVQEALRAAGIDEKEFAAVCTFDQGTENEFMGLRYEEFIALNTWQIQKLKATIKALEERVAKLEKAGGTTK